MTFAHYNFFVIGAGSGGTSAAIRAAKYGARVGIAEGSKLGGTCVNFGCVPKKIMWYAGSIKETLNGAPYYGFSFPHGPPTFSWENLKKNRDQSILRLNKLYQNNLETNHVSLYSHQASIVRHEADKIYVEVNNQLVTTDHLLIATGGTPMTLDVPGNEYTINSDDFFKLEHQPKTVAVIGAGYIAVELANIFTLLHSKTHLLIRGETPLRKFDQMIQKELMKNLIDQGCIVHTKSIIQKITKSEKNQKLTVHITDGKVVEDLDCVLVAIGRKPDIEGMMLNNLQQLKLNETNHICVDEFQTSTVPNIYAVGDVCGKVELTPMAIAAGRRLADRLFGGMPDAKADYEFVPTVIFTHPCIGTIGLTETQAEEKYGKDNIYIYQSTSVSLFYNVYDVLPEKKPKIVMKLICLTPENDKIIGMHIIGSGADEMLQGFAVAIKMGATKHDLDKCVAIHPTAAEEMVTLHPWGLHRF